MLHGAREKGWTGDVIASVAFAGAPVAGSHCMRRSLRMLHALANGYLADSAPELALASVLRNATVGASGPSGGTMFGDYYFLEALAYQQRQQAGQLLPE